MKEPETHTLVALILILDLIFYAFISWKAAAMAEDSGLPEAARLDIVNSQGLHLVGTVGHWISIFAIFCYFIEQIISLFFDGVSKFFLTSRVIDFVLWLISSCFLAYGGSHYALLNIPRICWRVYVICCVYIERASSSTNYYRQKVIKLNSLAKRQRKQMMDMSLTAEEMAKEIEDHKNHISELERALLIAAESEAVRMDLGTLTQYAAEGTKNRDDFAF